MTESTISNKLERAEGYIYSAMDTACRLLSGALEKRVEPVAAKYDAHPGIVEEGKAKELQAKTRELRTQLAKLCSTVTEENTIAASYEIARDLLADLWAVVIEDAQGIPSWIGSAVSRAINRRDNQDNQDN